VHFSPKIAVLLIFKLIAKTYLALFHNNGMDSIPKDAGIGAVKGLMGDIKYLP
jgi:hypothetical protein